MDYGDAMFTGGGAAKPDTPASEYTLGTRILKKGSKGTDVKALQEFLNRLGAELAVDGEFGSATESAVKAFQQKHALEVDGKYGVKTHTALMRAVAETDAPEQPAPVSTTVVIVSDGGSVNIRCGNGTQYERVTTSAPGSTFPLVATAENGWNAIALSDRVGWVSGKFSRII